MKNITFKEFNQLDPDKVLYYHSIFEHTKPSNALKVFIWTIRAIPLQDMKYGEVSMIRKDFVKGNFDRVFGLLFQSHHPNSRIRWFLNLVIFNVRLSNLRISQFYPVINWLKQELENISKAEKQLEGEWDEFAPSGDDLKVFGELNLIVPMGRQYGIKHNEIAENWKYKEVFTLALFDKRHSDYQREYQENVRKHGGK